MLYQNDRIPEWVQSFRKRKDGSTGYHAQVTIKRSGKIIHRETRTFDRRQAASAWLEKRETELAKPGAVERQKVPDPKLYRRNRPLHCGV